MVPPQMTTLPNGLTTNTEVGNVAMPDVLEDDVGLVAEDLLHAPCRSARDSPKRAFSSSGVSPPLRIMPANSLRLM